MAYKRKTKKSVEGSAPDQKSEAVAPSPSVADTGSVEPTLELAPGDGSPSSYKLSQDHRSVDPAPGRAPVLVSNPPDDPEVAELSPVPPQWTQEGMTKIVANLKGEMAEVSELVTYGFTAPRAGAIHTEQMRVLAALEKMAALMVPDVKMTGQVYRVTSTQPAFWRIGRQFGKKPVDIPCGELADQDVKNLYRPVPQLTVEVVDLDAEG